MEEKVADILELVAVFMLGIASGVSITKALQWRKERKDLQKIPRPCKHGCFNGVAFPNGCPIHGKT